MHATYTLDFGSFSETKSTPKDTEPATLIYFFARDVVDLYGRRNPYANAKDLNAIFADASDSISALFVEEETT